MDKLKNLKENIFGENNKHASDSIDFSVKPQQAQKNKLQLNPNQKEIIRRIVLNTITNWFCCKFWWWKDKILYSI